MSKGQSLAFVQSRRRMIKMKGAEPHIHSPSVRGKRRVMKMRKVQGQTRPQQKARDQGQKARDQTKGAEPHIRPQQKARYPRIHSRQKVREKEAGAEPHMHSQEKARDQDEGQSHIVVHGKRRMIRTKGQSLALVLVKKTKGQSLTFVRGRRSDEGAEPHTRSLQKARRRGRASQLSAAEGVR